MRRLRKIKVKVRLQLIRATPAKGSSKFRRRILQSSNLRLKNLRNKSKIQVRRTSRRKGRKVNSSNSSSSRSPSKSRDRRHRRAKKRCRRVRGRKAKITIQTVQRR